MHESTEELTARYADALMPLTIVLGLFAVVGVLGNILVLIVFSLGRAYRRNNYRVFVISFAVVDLFTSALLFPTEIIKHRNDYNFHSVGLCKIKMYINNYGAVAAGLSLLVISVDRFRKVCFPLKTQMSQSLALKLCVGLTFIFSGIVNVPIIVMSTIIRGNKTNIHGTNTTIFVCGFDHRYANHPMSFIYRLMSSIILFGVSISTIVMYIFIGRQIYKHRGALPLSVKGDSTRNNSDFTSDTLHTASTKSSDDRPVTAHVALQALNLNDSDDMKTTKDSTSPILKRPPLVKQGSASFDREHGDIRKKKLVSQHSQVSSSSLVSKFSSSPSRKRRTLSRQNSGFGLRRFPYKTLIWFILTVVFILTNIVSLVLAATDSGRAEKDPKSYAIYASFHRLYFINNIINPIVYFILDQHFRSVCKNIKPRLRARFYDCCK